MRMGKTNHQSVKRKLLFDWRSVRLGDACSVHPGQHILEAEYNREKLGIGYLTGPADFGTNHPTVTKWTENPKAWCEPGDVLVTVKGAGVGKINLAPAERVAIGRQLMAIRPKTGHLTQEFLYQIMMTHFSHLQGVALGATVPGLGREQIESLIIPLPPLPKQKRIAAILNEQLAAVERARAAAEAQLEAAKKLPTAYLRAAFESPEARKWPKKNLGEICRDVSDGTHFTPTYVASGVPFLSVKNVKETGLSFTDCRYITDEQHREFCRRCRPERGDVLYTKVGTTGIAKAIDTEREFSIFVSVALLKLSLTALPEYVERVLNAPISRVQAAQLTQGIANRNLVLQDLKRIEIPLPSLPEQRRVTMFLNERLLEAERLRRGLEECLNAVNKIPSALLRQAFNGEL